MLYIDVLHYLLLLSRMATEGQEIMVFCTASFRDWSKLPIDLLADILIRLPDSGLVRCKVVCKSWNDTIVNICIPKAFACAHLSELISTNGRFWLVTHVPHQATRGDIGSSFENLHRAFPSVPMSRLFCGCCNGLFLLSETRFFCVYNPATGQRVEIPTFNEASKRCYVSLAFDPSRSPHFKVVCYRVTMYTFKFYIYSSETGRWDVHKHKYNVERVRFGKSVYVNGILYCLSAQRNILLGVDVDNPKVCSIKLPWNIKDSVTGFIGESRNHLCYSNRDFFYMFVWRLEGYLDAPKWVLMHKTRIKPLIPIVGKEYRDSFTLYALDPNSDVIFIGTPRAIVAYDPHGRKVLRTHWAKYDNSDVSLFGGQYFTYPYIRCLVSLKNDEYYTSSTL